MPSSSARESLAVHQFPVGRVIIGRSPDNEIYIKSKFVSRHHAQLVNDSDNCIIEDLNSTNGVFVDEKQVKKYQLKDGDTVSLGVHQLVYTDLRKFNLADEGEEVEEDDEDEELSAARD
jgi:pSer/pThr/pTyr-binding forkhead associated (FHA) protein